MSLLNALTILGAGAARGYRASQELQRQIGEAKRKALMEEEDMKIRRDVARAQIAADQAQLEEATFGLGEKKRQVERGKRSAGALGSRLGIPDRGRMLTMEDIGDLGSIYAPLRREELEFGFRKERPDLYGSPGKTPLTEEEMAIQVAKELTPQLTQYEAITPDRLAAALEARRKFAQSILMRAPRLRFLFEGAPDTTNRFRGIEVK